MLMANDLEKLEEECNLMCLRLLLIFSLCPSNSAKMSFKGEKCCTLCLKVLKNEFSVIDEVVKQMISILLLKLQLNITKDTIICEDCVEDVKKSLNFKLTYLNTERTMLLFSTGTENAKPDMKGAFKVKEDVDRGVEDLGICRFCMTRLVRNNIVALDILWNEMNMSEMLQGYMPEMDFNDDENPLICATCRKNVEDYFKFIVNCLGIERKIEVYSKEEENNSMDQVHLGKAPIFPFKDVLESPQICTIKVESNIFENSEYVYLQTHSQFIKHEELDINEEEIHFDRNSKDRVSERQIKISKISADSKGKNAVNSNKRYSCPLCPYKHNHKSRLTRHMVTHVDESKLKMHNCSLCPYKARQKGNLKRHILTHKNIPERQVHKCSICAYETKRRHRLQIHFLTHKDVSEIEMHQCSTCAFKTKHKSNLTRHMIAHNVSETKMHRCSLCAYKTKQKNSLQAHLLLAHKDVFEIKLHKCTFCPYITKQKRYLKVHSLIHKDASEIQMYKCSLCAYESKRKDHLTAHTSVHNVSEIKMHKCSFCAYTAKQKRSLRNHLLKQTCF